MNFTKLWCQPRRFAPLLNVARRWRHRGLYKSREAVASYKSAVMGFQPFALRRRWR
ncbi:MAG: hypothetical protein AAFY16_08670 [Cyanobacteria bacterium J06642_3]